MYPFHPSIGCIMPSTQKRYIAREAWGSNLSITRPRQLYSYRCNFTPDWVRLPLPCCWCKLIIFSSCVLPVARARPS